MTLFKDTLEKRIDTPALLFLEETLSSDQELYLSKLYEEAFHIV